MSHDPDDIHLPGPSIWPLLFTFGLTVLMWGLIMHGVLLYIGLVLFVLALGGWLFEEELARMFGGNKSKPH